MTAPYNEKYGVPYVPDAAIETARDGAVEVVAEHLSAQSWWRRYANTATAGAALLASVVASVGVDQLVGATWAPWITMIVGSLVTVVAVANTKNGVTPQTQELVADVVSDSRVVVPLTEVTPPPTTSTNT